MNNNYRCMQKFLLIVITYSICLPIVAAIQCLTHGSCSCEMSDGSGTIDLSPISNAKPPRFKGIESNNKDYTFQYDPCQRFSNGGCKDVMVCQTNKNKLYQYDAGKQFSAQVSGINNQVKFIYHSVPAKRTTIITLICDPDAQNPKLEPFVEPADQPDHYLTKLTSKYACLSKNGKGKRISVGTVLCILLIIFIALYLGIGILINKYARNKEGKDVVPNINFWVDCPSLVKDGCVFTYKKVRGHSNEYEKI